MSFQNPSVQDFKDYFFRDFPYGTDPSIAIIDADITKAFQMTNINFPQGLWSDQASFTVGYLLLTAHYLCMNIRASSQGLNGQFNFIQNAKSVGSVSEGFAIPERVLANPDWVVLFKTTYGAQYLQILLPQLAGQVYNVYGTTRP